MRLQEILEAKDNSKRNKMLFFRQTIDSLLEKIKGKTVVVFDTETTGFSVLQPWIQVTEIAAVAIDADTGKEIDRFHRKIKLKPETKKEIEIQKKNSRPPTSPDAKDGDTGAREGPRAMAIPDLLKMTKYGEKNAPFQEITKVYSDWSDWLNSLDSPVMLGQNAAFDMGHMFGPMKKLGISRPKIGEVLDTMIFARTWIYPLLSAAAEAGDEDAKQMVGGLTNPKTGKLTFSLGPLGKALGVSGSHWHSGISDAMQTYGIFRKMIDILSKSKESGLENSDTFKTLHSKMSNQAFNYGKRPAFQATVKSDTDKGIAARGHPRT
jgi:DNA polymerase III alpha subunit (gram-positive type)